MSKLRNFRQMLEHKWIEGKSVCVGLDSDIEKIPKFFSKGFNCLNAIWAFNRTIVEATKDIVCAYKPNLAFYQMHGSKGISVLKRTIEDIHLIASDVPVILDAKYADIGNTNKGYVSAAFSFFKADAVTVHPYLGKEAMRPFLEMTEKGIIVLCRTSNPGGGEFQDMKIHINGMKLPLYQWVARNVAAKWNSNGNCALVVGATYPEELAEVRNVVGHMPILIPGVGFQQKDVPLEEQIRQVVSAGKNGRRQGMIINSSRGIIFASNGPDFAEAARRETEKLNNLINQYR